MRAWLLFLLLLAVAALAWQHGVRLPDRYNPWAPLRLDDAPNILTHYKLARLARRPAMCRAVLARSDAQYVPVADRQGADGCGWHGAVRLRRTGRAVLQRPALVTCPLAVSLVLFDRQVLQPQAQASFGQPVVRIDHVGSYVCRNIYGREQAPLSRHATAQAIDVTALTLGDGRRISIARDWGKGEAGAFLRALEDRGCAIFGMILGPRYNAAHRDHFHLQRPGGGYCR